MHGGGVGGGFQAAGIDEGLFLLQRHGEGVIGARHRFHVRRLHRHQGFGVGKQHQHIFHDRLLYQP
jgi:hypothetical protein